MEYFSGQWIYTMKTKKKILLDNKYKMTRRIPDVPDVPPVPDVPNVPPVPPVPEAWPMEQYTLDVLYAFWELIFSVWEKISSIFRKK